jgi:hypothetical protein
MRRFSSPRKVGGSAFQRNRCRSSTPASRNSPSGRELRCICAAASTASSASTAARGRRPDSDGTQRAAQHLLLALPFEQTQRLLATLPEGASLQSRAFCPRCNTSHTAPITTIHLWFNRIIMELDHAALLDTRIQWVFNKSRIRRDEPGASETGQYLELVISGSFAELHQTREQILSSALEELARFFPDRARGEGHPVRQSSRKRAPPSRSLPAWISIVPRRMQAVASILLATGRAPAGLPLWKAQRAAAVSPPRPSCREQQC